VRFRKVTVTPTTALPFAPRAKPCSVALFGAVCPGKRCCATDCRVELESFAPEADKGVTHDQQRSPHRLTAFIKKTRDGARILSGLGRAARFGTRKVHSFGVTIFSEPACNSAGSVGKNQDQGPDFWQYSSIIEHLFRGMIENDVSL
jgi:hypothetical protein